MASPSSHHLQQQHDDARPSALTERLLEQLCVGLEQDAKVRMDLEAKLERQQGEMAKLREEAVEARIQTAVQAAKEQARIEAELRIRELTPPAPNLRLSALQSRLEAMHAAKLLTDDEYFRMDDLVADFLELKASSGGGVAVGGEVEAVAEGTEVGGRLLKLMALSEGIAADGSFARQARRKLV
jgi:hypothetical protein